LAEAGKVRAVEARPEPSDAEIIAASLTDPARFAAIFDRHYEAIHRYLARRGGWKLAEDLTMTVFLKAFESRKRFRPSARDAGPWLYGIATNVLRRHSRTELRQLRAYARMPRSARADLDDAAVVERVDAGSAAAAVYAALARLADPDRHVLLLIAWADLSFEEVATALNVPIGTVRSRLHRARGRFRELLAASGQDKDMHVISVVERGNDG